MSRTLGISIFAISAGWVLWLLSRSAPNRLINVSDAAQKLREAWADNHTTAELSHEVL